MQIEEFKNRKKQMEEEIAKTIMASMESFREDTSYSPSHIDVSLAMYVKIGEKHRYYMLDNVRADITI